MDRPTIGILIELLIRRLERVLCHSLTELVTLSRWHLLVNMGAFANSRLRAH